MNSYAYKYVNSVLKAHFYLTKCQDYESLSFIKHYIYVIVKLLKSYCTLALFVTKFIQLSIDNRQFNQFHSRIHLNKNL